MQLPWGLSCGQRDQCICMPATYPRCPTTQGHSRQEDMELSRSCSLRSWEPNPTPENLLLTISLKVYLPSYLLQDFTPVILMIQKVLEKSC